MGSSENRYVPNSLSEKRNKNVPMPVVARMRSSCAFALLMNPVMRPAFHMDSR